MHEHCNDEIIRYLRSGRIQHTDSAGRSEAISPDRLMVVTAGPVSRTKKLCSGTIRFCFRSSCGLKPLVWAGVQFVSLDKTESIDRWRLLAGPIRLGGAELRPPGRLPLRWVHVGSGQYPIRSNKDRIYGQRPASQLGGLLAFLDKEEKPARSRGMGAPPSEVTIFAGFAIETLLGPRSCSPRPHPDRSQRSNTCFEAQVESVLSR